MRSEKAVEIIGIISERKLKVYNHFLDILSDEREVDKEELHKTINNLDSSNFLTESEKQTKKITVNVNIDKIIGDNSAIEKMLSDIFGYS
tara:strand:+ start:100 stop:369 length:270 start_codon:yes stop_codon:yes gene_type:complete